MSEFTGKYKLEKSDNFDNFLKELALLTALPSLPGVNFMLRKLANSTSPTLEITRNGDEFVFKTVSTVKTSTMTFTLGK
ncbi:unnamed protein product, partial [Oppiella nova]